MLAVVMEQVVEGPALVRAVGRVVLGWTSLVVALILMLLVRALE